MKTSYKCFLLTKKSVIYEPQIVKIQQKESKSQVNKDQKQISVEQKQRVKISSTPSPTNHIPTLFKSQTQINNSMLNLENSHTKYPKINIPKINGGKNLEGVANQSNFSLWLKLDKQVLLPPCIPFPIIHSFNFFFGCFLFWMTQCV
jgi:hypothetical protein